MKNETKIKIIKDEIVYDGKFIQTIKRHFIDCAGNEGIWEMVKHKTFGDIVGIAAITKDKKIVLEKAFRVPLNAYVLELPAGMMDRKGESEKELAERELLEETGYKAEKIEELIRGIFDIGIRNDEMVIYLGQNAHKIQEPRPEGAEDIEVIEVPLNNLIDYLSAQKEIKVDLKIASLLPYLERKGLL